jgi:hypothetical protein
VRACGLTVCSSHSGVMSAFHHAEPLLHAHCKVPKAKCRIVAVNEMPYFEQAVCSASRCLSDAGNLQQEGSDAKRGSPQQQPSPVEQQYSRQLISTRNPAQRAIRFAAAQWFAPQKLHMHRTPLQRYWGQVKMHALLHRLISQCTRQELSTALTP